MNRRANSRRWKLAVKIALGCVLAADISLGVISWNAAAEAPQSQAQKLMQLTRTAKLLSADVQRGQAIEKRIPDLATECSGFYQRDLLPVSSGYTSVVADIGRMFREAGVQSSGLKFSEDNVKDRGLEEVKISSGVEGDYPALIRLLEALERSPHFYLLDELSLSSDKSGMVKLDLKLRTYFRT